LAQGQHFSQRITGTYCQPYSWAHGQHQVDVLTEGATYNSSYWDWPQNPALYSYVDKTLGAGRATLAYDRLGTGRSSHPVSTDVSMPADAFILHQLVQGLHLLGFKQVNSIGHSYGSGIAMHEAATFRDVSRVVLTGYLHAASNPIVTAGTYPANQDPAFAGQNLGSGYLTSKPGVRGTNFHSASSDPAVVAYDEAHKDLVSATGFGGFFGDRGVTAGSNLSNQITAPTLLVVGQQDFIFCFNPAALDCADEAGIQAHEAPYYTGASNFSASTIPSSGHDIALHPSANQSFQAINQWIKAN
jgi:pimeloyl-ACP methyl ester carboxylesterase